MNDILFEILKAVIVLVIVLLARYAVPYFKQRIESSKYAWVADWVDLAVRSAEQTALGNKTGPEKKAIVTKFIKELLMQKNISLSEAQIDVLIESAVYAMNGEKA